MLCCSNSFDWAEVPRLAPFLPFAAPDAPLSPFSVQRCVRTGWFCFTAPPAPERRRCARRWRTSWLSAWGTGTPAGSCWRSTRTVSSARSDLRRSMLLLHSPPPLPKMLSGKWSDDQVKHNLVCPPPAELVATLWESQPVYRS